VKNLEVLQRQGGSLREEFTRMAAKECLARLGLHYVAGGPADDISKEDTDGFRKNVGLVVGRLEDKVLPYIVGEY
jgi:hypothetical protein